MRACLAAALALCLAAQTARAQGAPAGAASQSTSSALLKAPEPAPWVPMPEAKAELWPPLKENPKREDKGLQAVFLVGLGIMAATMMVIEVFDEDSDPAQADAADGAGR
jgi:hypothetical protein